MNRSGKVLAVNISPKKGTRKTNEGTSCPLPGQGPKDDAHGGPGNRQVSLLAMESIRKDGAPGLEVGPGDFAENLTTQGLDLMKLPLGTRLRIGHNSLLEVTQIGKVCHTRLRHLLPGGRLCHAQRGHLRPGTGGRDQSGGRDPCSRWGS